jgi:hypothetical protein
VLGSLLDNLLVSASSSPPPFKLVRQASPETEVFDEGIERIFEEYKANHDLTLEEYKANRVHINFKDDLRRLFRECLADPGGPKSTVVLEELLQRCMLRFEDLANVDIVKGELPSNVLDFITALLGKPPIFPAPPLVWFPPKFADAGWYCFQLCMEDAYLVDFGTFNHEPVQASLVGYVDCWGEGDSNFKGKGRMEIDLGLKVKDIVEVAVLGRVTCTGTAILLDSSSQVWFYNVPDAVDPYFEGMKARLALVKLPRNGMTIYAGLNFVQRHENVVVAVKEFDDDDEF